MGGGRDSTRAMQQRLMRWSRGSLTMMRRIVHIDGSMFYTFCTLKSYTWKIVFINNELIMCSKIIIC